MTIKYALMATTAAVLLTTGGIATAQQSAPPASRDVPAATSGKMSSASTLHEIDDAKIKISTLDGVTVKDLNDFAIYGSDGKKIGEIDRVLADSSNQPKAVAVDAGGFLGMGTHEVVFPLDKLTKGKEAKRLQTSMTKEQIQNLDKYEARANRAPSTATGAGGQPATSVPKR